MKADVLIDLFEGEMLEPEIRVLFEGANVEASRNESEFFEDRY